MELIGSIRRMVRRRIPIRVAMRTFKKLYAQAGLDEAGGNQLKASQILGCDRWNLHDWIWTMNLIANTRKHRVERTKSECLKSRKIC